MLSHRRWLKHQEQLKRVQSSGMSSSNMQVYDAANKIQWVVTAVTAAMAVIARKKNGTLHEQPCVR